MRPHAPQVAQGRLRDALSPQASLMPNNGQYNLQHRHDLHHP